MRDKHVWRVLFLGLFATVGLAASFSRPSRPSCYDAAPNRTHSQKSPNDSLESAQAPPVILVNDTKYEQLSCIGFDPILNRLSATIEIKLPYGFQGDLCSKGSFEYVRFWIDYGSGGGWSHVGLAAVNTHDIADSMDCSDSVTKPFFYTLSVKFNPENARCETPVLPRVRAILSWNTMPTLDPAFIPEWGNILEGNIQSLAEDFMPAMDVWKGDFNSSIDYMGSADGLGESHYDTCTGDQLVFSAQTGPHIDVLPNVEFEELTCLGLDWEISSLVATVRVKQRHGYEASPCQRTSFEHVSFWVDGEDSCQWTYVGTAKFNVHDFPSAPLSGLVYTVTLPVDVRKFSAHCKETKIVRVRAALAFNELPPEPPALAARGNFIGTHVHLQPYDKSTTGTVPIIRYIGNVKIDEIDTTTDSVTGGQTIPDAMIIGHGPADPSAPHGHRRCPFGGKIIIKGDPVVGHEYRLMVRPYPLPPGYVELPVTDTIEISDGRPGTAGRVNIPPLNSDGWFKYIDYTANFEHVLSFWRPRPGRWQIRLEMSRMVGSSRVIEGTTPWYMVLVNNRGPDVSNGGPHCGDFRVGDDVTGNFWATSEYFDHWSFETLPSSLNPNPVTVATVDSLTPVPPPGRAWRLTTSGAQRCGYVVRLHAKDRTVLDSGESPNRFSAVADQGFCLRAT